MNLTEELRKQAEQQAKLYKRFPIGGLRFEIATMAEGGCPHEAVTRVDGREYAEGTIKREEYYPGVPDEYFQYICDLMDWQYKKEEPCTSTQQTDTDQDCNEDTTPGDTVRTVSIKVTWEDYVYNVLRVYEHLDNDGKREAMENFLKIARMADKYAELMEAE